MTSGQDKSSMDLFDIDGRMKDPKTLNQDDLRVDCKKSLSNLDKQLSLEKITEFAKKQ